MHIWASYDTRCPPEALAIMMGSCCCSEWLSSAYPKLLMLSLGAALRRMSALRSLCTSWLVDSSLYSFSVYLQSSIKTMKEARWYKFIPLSTNRLDYIRLCVRYWKYQLRKEKYMTKRFPHRTASIMLAVAEMCEREKGEGRNSSR